MKVVIQVFDNEGFVSTFNNESEDLKLLRDKAVSFTDSILGCHPDLCVYGLKISNLNKDYNIPSHTDGIASGYKIPAIKAVRTVTSLGLKDAKSIVDVLEADSNNVSMLVKNNGTFFTFQEAQNAKVILDSLFSVVITKL